ncbi:MAG: 50S ribosomal protein L10 [Candidatus Omnitrophica bacterium]|nr:50S ribosomal protein L10 [Candidatus Omnitrophota bacterium]MBU4345881.1 50S ribosomal protein L10 [Candidatus Omnitrophota bacterium]MBU4473062.1 50S ribosomal protein L10 [Candidatus Omnitrophota bacterium]MCG2706647.1 50S ribosomal protein L10 [Candidatus Omnitrophota bacterium]
MKKIGLLIKETSENHIKSNLKESSAFFVVKHSGLSSPDLSTLRQSLRSINATLFVVKNSIARRALKSSDLEDFNKLIEGPCGLVFVKEGPVDTCRLLYNFSREHVQLKIEGGLVKNRIIEKKDIEALAQLPSLEVLRTQLVVVLNSPILRLAIVLKQVLRKFVYCLDQIKQKKTS